jgi:hypothetical protein
MQFEGQRYWPNMAEFGKQYRFTATGVAPKTTE